MLHICLSIDKSVLSGVDIKLGATTLPSYHCDEDLTCSAISSPTETRLPIEEIVEIAKINEKVVNLFIDKFDQNKSSFFDMLSLKIAKKYKKQSRIEINMKEIFCVEYNPNHTGCLLIINPDLMVKNNSQNAGIESKNFKVREAKS